MPPKRRRRSQSVINHRLSPTVMLRACGNTRPLLSSCQESNKNTQNKLRLEPARRAPFPGINQRYGFAQQQAKRLLPRDLVAAGRTEPAGVNGSKEAFIFEHDPLSEMMYAVFSNTHRCQCSAFIFEFGDTKAS